jgi:hypothetical protein
LLSNERICKKPLLLFKSFVGLTVQEFGDIYDKKIAKKYAKHEIQRLTKRKGRRRDIGAGRKAGRQEGRKAGRYVFQT